MLREESISEYIVLFVYSALNIQLNAAFLFVADASFFGINLYLVAAFENLTDDFREIETIKLENFILTINFYTYFFFFKSIS